MKIILTESQFAKVKLIKEANDLLSNFRSYSNKITEEINQMYSKVLFINVAKLLNREVVIEDMVKRLDVLELDILRVRRSVEQQIQGLPNNEDSNLSLEVDDVANGPLDKITALTLILNGLEEIQRYQLEHKLSKSFSDVKPINI